jgi:EAL domain-containing protein (putative c-di-GMP-specific phosphodiesterase class I)
VNPLRRRSSARPRRGHAGRDDESRLSLDLPAAIRRGQLRLEYQAELDLTTEEVLAVEALVRWDHPELGVLGAGRFIRIAEHNGMIGELGRWALRTACAQLAAWQDATPGLELVLRVNVSPVQLSDRSFPDLVEQTLADTGLAGAALCIEVTEDAEPPDRAGMIDVLRRVRASGVQVALDDFGVGRNSLLRLRELPYDVLKIDRSFVAALGTSPSESAIVASVISLGAALGMDVVAEGIETEQALAELIRLGCRRGQGYLLGEPASAEAMAFVLSARTS